MSMYLNVSLDALLRAELLRYEAQIKAIDILPRGRANPARLLTLTVTLMVCYATIVAFGLLRVLDL
jgi:hypothetical protein